MYPSSDAACRSFGVAQLHLAETALARQDRADALRRYEGACDQLECARFIERSAPATVTERAWALALKGLASLADSSARKLALLKVQCLLLWSWFA